ncbi:MAG: GIY-YIG nuclease family protein [Selenomonadaceae bacterium]|nr:GIY-YIG nuclease family protein [Selenomonadaceae bacterium]
MNGNSSGGESQQGVIYKITNTLNGKLYVGQTRQKFGTRIRQHKCDSKKAKVGIGAAIRKYDWENFSVEVLETCPVEKLNEREIFWIRELNSKSPNGYNLTDGGDTGSKISEESRARMSVAKKGKPSKRKGKTLTEEHKAKISATKKGTPAHNKGKHMSEAQKAILSAANKGENNPNYGKHRTPETIAKIIESNKRTWARKKLENGGNK